MARLTKLHVAAPKIARIVAVVATIVVIYFHILFALNAGALWRDEVNSLEVATMRTFSEMWTSLSFDSFPALFFVLLRAVAAIFGPLSDGVLRIFGAAIGLLILGIMWVNARWLRLGVPLVSLVLVGLNPLIVRYGDSIRAYGLGILLVLLMVGSMWRLLENFTLKRALLPALIAILSVQTLYYNAVLLFAVCAGAAAVSLGRRNLMQVLAVIGIGAAAAITLLPYIPIMQRVQSCNFMWKVPFTATLLWEKASETLGSPIPRGIFIWAALFAGVFAIAAWSFTRAKSSSERIDRERALFALVTLIVGTVSYGGFLKVLSYRTQPWYYIAFVAFAATCIEMVFSALVPAGKSLLGRSCFALIFLTTVFLPALAALEARQTNVDLIAHKLEQVANGDDLIILNSWNYGIPFRRYYRGPVHYQTVPPIEDLRTHRVDLAKKQMMSAEPIKPVLLEVEKTLRAGKTVWLVGMVKFLPAGAAPLIVSPGRDTPDGWSGGGFYQAWSEQTGFFLQHHAVDISRVQVPVDQAIVRYENLPLTAISGWQDEGTVQ